MAWGSTVPAAITALAATLRTGLAPVSVRDGATVTDSGALEAVSVAFQTEDQDAVEMAFDPYASAADLEEYTINCAVHVLAGRDLPAARARVFVLFGQVGTLIKANRTLGLNPDGTDVVMRAWVSSGSLRTDQTDNGPVASIPFAVTCQAETTE
jgi:hypothetical protein